MTQPNTNLANSGENKFSGIQDKNGIDIYAGHIITYDGITSSGKRIIRHVHYDNEKMIFMAGMYPLVNNSMPAPIVIGDIYNNPELLTPTNQ